MSTRTGSAVWNGTLKEGNGTVRTGSGGFEGAYSFSSRFEEGEGTNPEELIAAAHAGCFSMAFSADLEKAGFKANKVETTAKVYLEKTDAGPTVTKIHLDSTADVPEISEERFHEVAEGAKANCPISRLLKTAEISLDAKLKK